MSAAVERALAGFALIALAPLFVLIGGLILLLDGSPVLFRQRRVGHRGQDFFILKFRTMRAGASGELITGSNDRRITRTGRWLRRSKLDELPQLVNVLRGEMRFIGPRPEVPEYVDMGDTRWRAVLSVKPGITDLATLLFRHEERLLGGSDEVSGVYRTSIQPRKLQLNLEHLQSRTFRSDLMLIALTAWWSAFPRGFDADRAYRMVTNKSNEH